MLPGGDPGRSQIRQMRAQRVQQRVTPAPVDRTHPAQVTVELAAAEKVGERQLVDDRRTPVGEQLRRRDVGDQVSGHHHPAEPQPRRERLAGRAAVDDMLGRQALHGAHRRPVVAVLSVVVVLDHDRAAASRPADRLGPGRRRQHPAGRPLVRRREDQRVGVDQVEGLDLNAVRAHRDADHVQTRGRCEHPGVVVGRRVLQGYPPGAAPREHLDQQRDALPIAVADDHVAGVGQRAAHPVEVVAQGLPQFRHPAPVEVDEPVVGCGGEHGAHRAQPGGPRKLRHVGAPVSEVDPEAGITGVRLRRRRPSACVGFGSGRRHRHGDLGVTPRSAGEVALGHELLVGLHDHPARNPEPGREGAGGRQRRARTQPAGPDARADGRLDLPVQWHPGVAVQFDEQVLGRAGAGPQSPHGIGPYPGRRCRGSSRMCSFCEVVRQPSAFTK